MGPGASCPRVEYHFRASAERRCGSEDVLIPLIDEPEYHFHSASRYFSQGNYSRSAGEVRIVAALFKIEAGRHDATNKAELDAQAQHLDGLAAEIGKGSVKFPKELNNAFAAADLALARHYHQMAEASADQNKRENTGYWLHGTADSLADSVRWSGHKLAQADSTTVNDARSLGDRLEGGAEWTADKVKEAVSKLGNEIETLTDGETKVTASTGSPESTRE